MKYENEIIINLPRSRVIELFDNVENMKHWQEGFVSYEHLSGNPGEVESKARLNYLMGRKKVELIETITSKNLPDEFSGTYETKGIWNRVENYFNDMDGNQTKWVAVTEFKLSGLLKIIGFLMPGSFKKQSRKMMEAFKTFAESK